MPKNSDHSSEYGDLYALDGDVDSWTIGDNTEKDEKIIIANINM